MSLKSLRRTLFKKLGYVKCESPYRIVSPFEAQRQLIRNKQPIILDVGALTGQTIDQYHATFPDGHIHSFEPLPDSFQVLEKKYGSQSHVSLHHQALSNTDGELEFYVTQGSGTQSLLPPTQESVKWSPPGSMNTQKTITVPSSTLDTFCRKQQMDHIDILKMDVQGAEKMILEGAANLLQEKKIGLIYTEVLFVPLYEGQAYFHDIVSLLEGYGYHIYDLFCRRYAEDGRVKWADALFVGSR